MLLSQWWCLLYKCQVFVENKKSHEGISSVLSQRCGIGKYWVWMRLRGNAVIRTISKCLLVLMLDT